VRKEISESSDILSWHDDPSDDLSSVDFWDLKVTNCDLKMIHPSSLVTVQELGGWQTLAMVERYAHLSPAHKAQALERIAMQVSSEPEKSIQA